ncbi:MAG: hypothetical protein SVR94_05265, partial [Pseudomonadota bacterium]|nr:hypothetical protein [Pseudomonadota bacterium]
MLNDLKDNLEKKQRLINFLLECPSFKNKHDFLIRELPHYISNAIENNEQPRIRMFNIVSTCSLYNDGFEQLFKVLKSFDGNTIPFNKMVDEFIVPETKETVKSMKLNEALAEWKKVEELAPNSSQVSS